MSRWVLGRVAAVLAVAAAAASSVAADDPAAVVKKAIAAHGGADALNKTKAGTSKVKGDLWVFGMDLVFTGETAYELPDKYRMTLDTEVFGQKMTLVQVVNGKAVKNTVNGMPQPVGDAEKAELLQAATMQEVSQLTPLLTAKYTLAAAKDEDVDGAPAAVVTVAGANFKDTKLFFDKKTGLLVKTSRKGLAPGMPEPTEALEEVVMGDFKKVDGVMMPMRLTVTHDGKKFMAVTVTEAKTMTKADPKMFAAGD